MGEELYGDVDAAYLCLLTINDLLYEAETQINERMMGLIKERSTDQELVNLSNINARISIMSEDMESLLDRFTEKKP